MRTNRIRMLLAIALALVLGATSTAAGAPTEVQKLQEQIKALQSESTKAGQAYSEAFWRLDATRVEISRVDQEMAATEARLVQVNARLAQRAVEMYRAGGNDYMGLLLSSNTIDDMFLRLDYMQRMNDQDADIVAEMEALRVSLEASRVTLEDLKTQQAEEAAVLKDQAAKIDAELKTQQAQYDKLQKQLKAAMEAEKARKAPSSAKAGPNGMIFPVAGPCTYTDTWGAARSGGRSHKGTDIMANEGVPCVAVLGGTVRAKDNSLGGKTIWLTADNGWAFYYAHLSSYKVTSGRVEAGQVIGYVGSTGNAGTTNHLHFEIHPNGGSAVNPYSYLRQMQ